MGTSDLPESVRRFIGSHIVSVEQLEVLLLLYRATPPEWTAERVSEELRTSLTSAAQRLEDLARRGLADRGGDGAYRFQSGDRGLGEVVGGLERAYEERRYTVIELIFAKPIDELRVYADAFRFRKDEDG